MGVCNCLCWSLGLTNQPCQPTSSSSYLLRRHSPCPAPPPTRHVQYQKQLPVHQRRREELVSVPVGSSATERSALLTRLPCQAAALILELVKVFLAHAEARGLMGGQR